MPSVLYDGAVSGPLHLISGNPWSGQAVPTGGIQLVADRNNSGNVYVGFSGGMTQKSGGFPLSGGGILDGIQIGPGGTYFCPKVLLRAISSGAGLAGAGNSGLAALYSGNPFNIFILGDAAVSGQAVIYYEPI